VGGLLRSNGVPDGVAAGSREIWVTIHGV
jgi:hypothetical protein